MPWEHHILKGWFGQIWVKCILSVEYRRKEVQQRPSSTFLVTYGI